jgi:SulP family sulfate permease
MTWTEWAPGVAQFGGYKRAWLRGDLLAGLTVAAYLIPQVMAYATLAGLSPIVGLWTALACVKQDLRDALTRAAC